MSVAAFGGAATNGPSCPQIAGAEAISQSRKKVDAKKLNSYPE
jgi:hypothetical protein